MASGLAPSGESAVLGPLTSSVYVSLHVGTAGTIVTTANEVPTAGGTNYGRQLVAWTTSGSEPTVSRNTSVINFNQAGVAWGTINQFGIWSAASAGNLLGWGDLATPKSVNINDTARFAANALSITAN